jgi:hypothetical protein
MEHVRCHKGAMLRKGIRGVLEVLPPL